MILTIVFAGCGGGGGGGGSSTPKPAPQPAVVTYSVPTIMAHVMRTPPAGNLSISGKRYTGESLTGTGSAGSLIVTRTGFENQIALSVGSTITANIIQHNLNGTTTTIPTFTSSGTLFYNASNYHLLGSKSDVDYIVITNHNGYPTNVRAGDPKIPIATGTRYTNQFKTVYQGISKYFVRIMPESSSTSFFYIIRDDYDTNGVLVITSISAFRTDNYGSNIKWLGVATYTTALELFFEVL